MKRKISIGLETNRKILAISFLISVILITSVSLITQDVGSIVNVGIICLFIIITPIFLYKYAEYVWIKAIEREFPNFIRDLASSKRSGMTLADGIKMATKTNYGKLSLEVKSMANRLSWGTPFLRVLDIFSKKFKKSKIINEVIEVINESYKSGGNTAAILESTARDMLTLREAEEERKSIVRQHVIVMYGIFFLFTGIAIAIIYVLVPMLTAQTQTAVQGPMAFQFSNPCEATPFIFPCGYFGVLCSAFDIPEGGVGCYYIALFFSVLIIQALFTGLIAGQLGENSILAGIKHSLIMLAFVFVVFIFLIKIGVLPGGLPTAGFTPPT